MQAEDDESTPQMRERLYALTIAVLLDAAGGRLALKVEDLERMSGRGLMIYTNPVTHEIHVELLQRRQ